MLRYQKNFNLTSVAVISLSSIFRFFFSYVLFYNIFYNILSTTWAFAFLSLIGSTEYPLRIYIAISYNNPLFVLYIWAYCENERVLSLLYVYLSPSIKNRVNNTLNIRQVSFSLLLHALNSGVYEASHMPLALQLNSVGVLAC